MTVAQLHTSIVVDAEGALATVRRLIEPAPFSDPSLVSVETDLVRILEAAEQAERLGRHVARTLAGPALVGEA
jgi:hypothetical protein